MVLFRPMESQIDIPLARCALTFLVVSVKCAALLQRILGRYIIPPSVVEAIALLGLPSWLHDLLCTLVLDGSTGSGEA